MKTVTRASLTVDLNPALEQRLTHACREYIKQIRKMIAAQGHDNPSAENIMSNSMVNLIGQQMLGKPVAEDAPEAIGCAVGATFKALNQTLNETLGADAGQRFRTAAISQINSVLFFENQFPTTPPESKN